MSFQPLTLAFYSALISALKIHFITIITVNESDVVTSQLYFNFTIIGN